MSTQLGGIACRYWWGYIAMVITDGAFCAIRRQRRLVIGAAVVALLIKLVLAARTYGTSDIFAWMLFADGVRSDGPVAVYGHEFPMVYNHPPLISLFLVIVNVLQDWGVALKITIRATASAADLVTALLVFELIRRHGSLEQATGAGILISASPILLIISGFHGNTDPIFVALALGAVYLISVQRRSGLAGMVIALALSVKIVPIVVVPALLVFALYLGLRELARFALAAAATLTLIWAPALISEPSGVLNNVLGYRGMPIRQWGLVQVGHWFGDPGWAQFLSGSGTVLLVAVSAVVPAVLVFRRPDSLPAAVGLSLALGLALASAFGQQYLVWPAAALFLATFWGAVAYNAVAGVFLFVVYNRWAGGLPWDQAIGSPMTSGEAVFGVVAWLVLVAAIGAGLCSEIGRQSAEWPLFPSAAPPMPPGKMENRLRISSAGGGQAPRPAQRRQE